MNGQQLTNSSNSANETPTSPSSSYPASLSSQSSRDPSPASRVNNALPAQIDHKLYADTNRSYSQNHWQPDNLKSAGHLVNNISSQPTTRSNLLFNNSLSDQRSNFVMPTPLTPLKDGNVLQTSIADTQGSMRSTPTSMQNHLSNSQNALHNDLKTMGDVRRSPLATPLTSGSPRTNVQGTLSSTLPSHARQGTTSPVVTQDSTSNAQTNSGSGEPDSNPITTNSVTQVQRPIQSSSTGTSGQFKFTSQSLNFSQTPASQTQPPSSQNQFPVSTTSHNMFQPSSAGQNQFRTSNIQTNPFSQNQYHPTPQPVSNNQNQFQPPSSQANPIVQNQFQPPSAQSNPIIQPPNSQSQIKFQSSGQNQFRSPISQANLQSQSLPPSSQPSVNSQNQFQPPGQNQSLPPSSSQPSISSQNQFQHPGQNQFRPPSSQANPLQNQPLPPSSQHLISSQNQFRPTSTQANPLQNQSLPPNSQPSINSQNQFQPPGQDISKNQFQPPTNQYQQMPNKSQLTQQNKYPVPLQPVQVQPTSTPNRYQLPPSQHQNSTVPPSAYPQPLRANYPHAQQQVNSQLPMQNQLQQPYNTASGQNIQGQNDFHNQSVGQYPMNKRYPQMSGYGGAPSMGVDGLTQQMTGMSVQAGFNKLWGMDTLDLLKTREILPKEKCEAPPIRLQHELYEAANCSPELFRCTLSKIPETKSLLDKSRLPLGVLIHPFKDLNQLSVIQCTVIVRCRVCRTYINPFVYFVDNKRWKCNLCFRVNELPEEFQFDPMTKTYGDPSRRPEIKSATIEFIAPSEYMVRPPQPAIYVFLLDVSRLAADCGYLEVVCRVLMEELDNLPGDARTSVAFITYDSTVHFYSLAEGLARPHQMTVVDIDDMFLPCPENLLVNLNECHELIRDLLADLPTRFKESFDTGSALGAALQAAYKLLAPTGGRISVFQACLPNLGPGALTAREDPAQRAGENVAHLNPVTDFYKKLALDCSGQQIAVDLFLVNSQYIDLATLSGVSKFSGGCIHHFPLFRNDKPILVQNLEKILQRYLVRKIGFESVMRLRCTRGLSIHTFHGNFFVRSTDLLSLPNANPDAGFGMQVSIDENLSDVQTVCFQAALLYTSSKGERRIRVHTLCLPIVSNLSDVLHGADQNCIVGLLAKMAVDRSVQSSLSDAREAFLNVAADVLSAYKLTQSMSTAGCVLAPGSLRLLPMYILSLLKYMAFRVGQSTRLDDRVFAMCQMKTLPLCSLLQTIYPDMYPVHNLEQHLVMTSMEGSHAVPQPPRLHLSAERIDSTGVYLLDDSSSIIIYVGHNVHPSICLAFFNVSHFAAIPQEMYELPDLDNPESERLRSFVQYLQSDKPYPVPISIIRDDSPNRMRFIERLIEDKTEAGPSYYEFLQRIKALIK